MRALFRHWAGLARTRRTSRPEARPLMTGEELSVLSAQVERARVALLHRKEIRQRHAGEFRSAFLGRGLEFEEVRAYQPGDDLRHMDWRTTARTGRPVVRVFREEHQPMLHLIVDRGPTMRFGTHERLKVTQAARAAAVFALMLAKNNTRIGGTLLEEEVHHVPARAGHPGALSFLQRAVRFCPPISLAGHIDCGRFLKRLDGTLPRGSRVVIASDFQFLESRHASVLAQLAYHHETTAVHIVDPAETHLPDVGVAPFLGADDDAFFVDTSRRVVRDDLNRRFSSYMDEKEALLRRAGVSYARLSTTEDVLPLITLASPHG